MRRVVAHFEDEADAAAAAAALRETGLEPERPGIENPFFDPVARVPEARGILLGAVLGGLVGLALFAAIDADLLWIPRISPMMPAGEFAVPVLGFGLGAAAGGFVGGALGTLRPVSTPAGPTVAVEAPDDRVGEATRVVRAYDPVAVDGSVTYHENPQRPVGR